MLKRVLLIVGLLLGAAVLGGGGFVMSKVSAFDASMAQTYDFPAPAVTLSTEPEVLARGKHLAESLGACTNCHGATLGGGKLDDMGPIGKVVHANITNGKDGKLASYSDGELMRLLRHGVKRDGRSLNLMPVGEFSWWPDADRVALISYLRSVPPVDGNPGSVEWTAMGKVLDRLDSMPIDAARRVDHQAASSSNVPAASVAYGGDLAQLCRGCHNPKLTGGPIPGTPPDFGTPKNLTPHESGLKDYSFDDFKKVVTTGVKRDGSKLSSFMPVAALANFSDDELQALWLYLRSLPPKPMADKS